MQVIGAGFSGLIATALNRTSVCYEEQPSPRQSHQALLRFRDDKIGRALGIDFQPVTVHKAIYSNGQFTPPNIQLANRYAAKVAALVSPRSIWNTDTVDRYIAPTDFYERLLALCDGRIRWGHRWYVDGLQPVISTIPLPSLLDALPRQLEDGATHPFNYAAIHVKRVQLLDVNVYQTIYFPDLDTSIYRASITGNLLIIESTEEFFTDEVGELVEIFGLRRSMIQTVLPSHEQRYGKIVPVPDAWRKRLIYQLTQQYNIYSLGRFAVWRNLLLDDVYDDMLKIRRMVNMSAYDTRKEYMI